MCSKRGWFGPEVLFRADLDLKPIEWDLAVGGTSNWLS
jgi:hypothetical protein